MKFRHLSSGLLYILGSVALSPIGAQISPAPSLLNFGGRLAKPDGTPVANGTYSIRFSLWNSNTAGTELWNQTISSITVTNGTFAALLNTNTANLFNGNVWLEIKIGSDLALTPRQQVVSVAYAIKANSVPDGSIGATQIANGSITSSKLVAGTLDAVSWLLGGNSISNPTTQFLGTVGNQPLVFRTNNVERIRVLSDGSVGIGVTSPTALLHLNGTLKINAANILEFGAGVAGKESSAGKIGYQTFTSDALDIVGAGTSATNRKIKLFAEGGTIFNGPLTATTGFFTGAITAPGATFTGAVTASSATIPTLSGNVTVGGELTANVVTVLGGSDVAEPYNVAPSGNVKAIPGFVVAIDPDKIGQMRVADKAYDTTVAGIVSGANGISPGITLRQKGTVADGELPVASIGRVWCWCDADTNGAIRAGDLLTTSDTPGHAMKATDREWRDGAVIGKAMSFLKSGKGLVLVLVSLK